jgi:hypothetical protein
VNGSHHCSEEACSGLPLFELAHELPHLPGVVALTARDDVEDHCRAPLRVHRRVALGPSLDGLVPFLPSLT